MPDVQTGVLDCGGCDYAVWAFPRDVLCPEEDPIEGPPCDRLVKLRVEWVPCVRWYCVADTDADEGATCATGPRTIVSLAPDESADDLLVCSGPYDTEAEAIAACAEDLPSPGAACADAPLVTADVLYTGTTPAGTGSEWYEITGVTPGETVRATFSRESGCCMQLNLYTGTSCVGMDTSAVLDGQTCCELTAQDRVWVEVLYIDAHWYTFTVSEGECP